MATINARCNHCGSTNKVDIGREGQQAECAECGWKFTIPLEPTCGPRSLPARSKPLSPDPLPSFVTSFMPALAGLAVCVVLVVVVALTYKGERSSKPPVAYGTGAGEPDKSNTGYMAQTPDQAANEVLNRIVSTPEGRRAVDRLASKDDQLTEFQRERGISDRVAEASIKEWVITHGGNFDWNLEEVKAICLRNARSGIPYKYLPEAEKRR